MLGLDQLQRRMCSAVRGCYEPELLDLVEGSRIAPEARLRIYCNNTALSLTEALKATYPVVCRLVDERFFSYAAHEYIRENLPSRPCLAEYGGGFADFLASFAPCRDLVYLPDVARLEWAVNMSLHAEAAKPRDRSALQMPDPVLALHPSVRLIASRWPIDRIWEANQSEVGLKTEISLDSGAIQLKIYRRGDRVVIIGVDYGTYAFLDAIARGIRLTQAVEGGRRAAPIFNPEPELDLLIEEGLIVASPPLDQSCDRIARIKIITAGEKRRPDIETSETSRTTSGPVTG